MKILLITPPMTQVNTPYPATAYLTAFLRTHGHEVEQRDLGIDLIDQLFSRSGLLRIREHLLKAKKQSSSLRFFLEAFDDYLATIEPVMKFLRYQDPSLALRLVNRHFVPEGPRFIPLNDHAELLDLFGSMGIQDKAKYLASLFLDDLADIIKEGIDEHFQLSRYGESLAESQISFEPLKSRLESDSTLIDEMIVELTKNYVTAVNPKLVGFTVPFPGNLYGALRSLQTIKRLFPQVTTVMGGGYINTELRSLSDSRFFDFVDFLTFDDGEKPLLCLIEHLEGRRPKEQLLRTLSRENGQLIHRSTSDEKDPPFKETKAPALSGLPLDKYFSMLELPNPMHRLWSDFRWNKMLLAHGCYWKKCTFCDTSLDYIQRFEPARVNDLIEHIKSLIAETGQTGFHFVDEAAPPALLKSLSEQLIQQNIKISWWGNLRFDKQFSPELTELMADAGCVAVTGGLEVGSPRVLNLINKGVTVEQVARVSKNFSEAGIYVHAYLMYGYPTQTEQETIDSLELVRQLFSEGCLHSAYWHRFVCTTHSPVGRQPEKFGIQLIPVEVPAQGLFARNEIPFYDPTPCSHEELGRGLRKALYNFMHGVALDKNLQFWFEPKIPRPAIPPHFISKVLKG